MIYLIDGHNLIGKLPDIELSDPDDEQKLIKKIQDWTRLDYRRRVQLFFDAGEFGGLGNTLSAPTVRVQFSRVGQTADSVIVKFLESIKNPQEFTLVTSDQEIIYAARKKRIGYILSEEFALLLAEKPEEDEQDSALSQEPGTEEEVDVSDVEVQTWMQAFEKAPHRAPDIHIVKLPKRENDPQITNEPKQNSKNKKVVEANLDQLKKGDGDLTEQDLNEWMTLFGDESIQEKRANNRPVVVPDPSQKRTQKTKRKKGDPVVRKYAEGGLNEEEINTWLDFFQENKKKPDN